MGNRSKKTEAEADREAVDLLVLTLSEFCKHMEPRTSIRQALAFALIVRAHISGGGVTVAELQNNDPEAGVLGAFFGQGVARTHIALEDKGWITFAEDHGDRRRKPIELTPEGERVAARLIRHLKE